MDIEPELLDELMQQVRSDLGRAGARASWERTEDRAARTARAREGFRQRLLDGIDPEGNLSPQEREQRAAEALSEYYRGLSAKGVAARRARKQSSA